MEPLAMATVTLRVQVKEILEDFTMDTYCCWEYRLGRRHQ